MDLALVIPARFASSRLPGKPLVPILGREMILRTYDCCAAALDADNIYVATDDSRIASVCERHGIQVLMTSDSCLTGTDRVAEAAEQLGVSHVINIQGDEPVFRPDDIRILIEAIARMPDAVINGYCKIEDEVAYRSLDIPKVVMRPDGRLIYASRSPVPATKNGDFSTAHRQVCAYAFPRKALVDFTQQRQKTPLEAIEDIEILRFLEIGWDPVMIQMSNQSISVDRQEDVAKVEAFLELREWRNDGP